MSTALVVAGVLLVVLGAAVFVARVIRRRRRSNEQAFEGTFTFGWEVSLFVPGDASRQGPRYWLAWTPESRFMERFRQCGYDPAWTPGYGRVRTRFLGVLENGAVGGYGHMGQYEAQVTVTRVLEMGRAELAESR